MQQRIVEDLTEDQRETLRLHFFEGYTFAEIADKLGQSDLGHERAQWLAKLADEDTTIADLKRQLSRQEAAIAASKAKATAGRRRENERKSTEQSSQ